MTDLIKEQLSACLDGELPEAELDLLVKQVGRDTKLQASLGRYALIGEALRAQRPVAAPADFAQRIAAAIEADSTQTAVTQKPVRSAPRWLRPVAGMAVAAGVAAVAIVTLQPSDEIAVPAVAQVASNPTEIQPADSYIVPAGTASSGFVPATRLTNYVVAHSEYSTPLGRRSMLTGVLADESGDDVDTGSDADETATTVAPQP